MLHVQSSEYKVINRRPIADLFRRLADWPVQWCVKLRVHPNYISLLSLAAAAGAACCFLASSQLPWLALCGVSLSFWRLYFNMLDGMVALAASKASATGELANELPDRISDVLIFTAVAHSFMNIPILGYWCAILSLLVAYVGTLGQAVGAKRDYSGPMSKPWRMVVLAIGVIVSYFQFRQAYTLPMVTTTVSGVDIACLVIALGCILTFVRRLARIVRQLRVKQTEAL